MILQILQKFIGSTFFFDLFTPPVKFFFFFLIAFFILFLYLTLYIYIQYAKLKKNIDISSNNEKYTKYNDSLVHILETAYNNQRWSEVVKIGRQLSEPLWYTGKFKIRVIIGEMVESAATFTGQYDIQAETLLDDIGWTNFRLNNQQDAIKNIKRGLNVATAHNNSYLMAKGNRHFADIYLSNKEFDKCLEFYNIACSYLDMINNEKKKVEMQGNLQYTLAKYYFAKNEFDNAYKAVLESKALYVSIDDLDREVKLYNLMGKILLKQTKESEAVLTFSDGLRKATEISNNVHMASNSAALAEYYYNEGKIELAGKMIEIALKNSVAMNDPLLLNKIVSIQRMIYSFRD